MEARTGQEVSSAQSGLTGHTGFEPVLSRVTGERVDRFHQCLIEQARKDSNLHPLVLETSALPVKLRTCKTAPRLGHCHGAEKADPLTRRMDGSYPPTAILSRDRLSSRESHGVVLFRGCTLPAGFKAFAGTFALPASGSVAAPTARHAGWPRLFYVEETGRFEKLRIATRRVPRLTNLGGKSAGGRNSRVHLLFWNCLPRHGS